MKISKLFHWLYAVLMLLPVIAIGVTCGYVMFNKNAYQSNGNSYIERSITLNSSNAASTYVTGAWVKYTFTEHNLQYNGSFGFSNISLDLNSIFNTDTTFIRFYLYKDNQNINFYDINGYQYQILSSNRTFNDFTYQVDLSVSNDISIYNYGLAQVFVYQERALTDTFYYSVEQVKSNKLFSWADYSFVKTPIEYVTSLFGMETNNPILTIMSYWLSISVIWLCFDIILYVPLLVHRLIDKGMVD